MALTIAYFSMPAAVVAFKPSRITFFVALLVIMVLVRLLFDILGGRLLQTWWWHGATQLLNLGSAKANSSASKAGYLGRLPATPARRRRTSSEFVPNGIELVRTV